MGDPRGGGTRRRRPRGSRSSRDGSYSAGPALSWRGFAGDLRASRLTWSLPSTTFRRRHGKRSGGVVRVVSGWSGPNGRGGQNLLLPTLAEPWTDGFQLGTVW